MLLHHLFEHVTDSPEFQRWFAGSKIVDAEGEPLKLYHGTSKDQDFRKFRVPGNGVWFTANPKDASNYAEENDSQGHVWDGGRPIRTHTASRVIPVYVRAVNPLRIDPEAQPEKVRYASNYRAAQREWFNQLRAQGYDALVMGDIVVVLKDANQIKSAIGNKAFNPAKAGFTEAAIPFGQSVDVSGFTFGFEAEFLISEGYMVDKSWNDIDELASNEGTRFLERHFDMPDLNEALAAWQEDHPGEDDIEEMLNDLGAMDFLKRVGAEPHDDVRYDPDTGQFAANEKSQVDAFYDVADDLSEDVGIHPRIFQAAHQSDKQPDEWYLEPDDTVNGNRGLDYDAELTSPIIDDYDEFLSYMTHVFNWIGKYDTDWVYTNSTCGIHINIGPPTSFDPIKFIVFAGEDWMAKLFPRASSHYTDPLIAKLRDKVTFARSFDNFIQQLLKQLQELNDKMFTVNFLPWFEGQGYVEVRVIGGQGYEKRLAEIKRHIDRLLVLFKIASNPAKYRQAYMQKVYRYFIGAQRDALTQPQQTMAARQFIAYARQMRIPDNQIGRFVTDGRITASPEQVFGWVVTMLADDQPVPSNLLKLVCREIRLKQSQVDELSGGLSRYWTEDHPELVARAVELLTKCAVPG